MTEQPRPTVAMLLYPGVTPLDVVAPHAALAPHTDMHLAWKTLDPVVSDVGMALTPTTTFDACPSDVDVLFVPGGRDQADAASDEEVLQFLADRGHARYITSVCGGGLILAAAGLLTGYRAATHWTGRHTLEALGAVNVNERVVTDRNRITGGGVTAGLDFGLVLLAELLGEPVARATQLMLEYDPQPPFDSGSPEKAGPELTAMVRQLTSATSDAMDAVAASLPARGWATARQTAASSASTLR
jgi:transcriptional regulator GlxA family with amidase domain